MKWEYVVVLVKVKGWTSKPKITIQDTGEETTLDRLGAEGWELIAMSGYGGAWIFKRPIKED